MADGFLCWSFLCWGFPQLSTLSFIVRVSSISKTIEMLKKHSHRSSLVYGFICRKKAKLFHHFGRAGRIRNSRETTSIHPLEVSDFVYVFLYWRQSLPHSFVCQRGFSLINSEQPSFELSSIIFSNSRVILA